MDEPQATITQSVPRPQCDALADAHDIVMLVAEDDETCHAIPPRAAAADFPPQLGDAR